MRRFAGVISYGLTFLLLVALKQGSEPQAMSAADPQELRSPLIRPSQGRGVPPIIQTTTPNPSLRGGAFFIHRKACLFIVGCP